MDADVSLDGNALEGSAPEGSALEGSALDGGPLPPPVEIVAVDGGALGPAFAAGPAGVVWSSNVAIYGLSSTGEPVVMVTGGDAITKDAVVTSADLIIARPGIGAVVRCPYGVACLSISNNTATGFNRPGPLSLDGAGALYVAETNGSLRLMTCTADSCRVTSAQFGTALLPMGVTSIAAAGGHVAVVIATGQIRVYAATSEPTTLREASGAVEGIANDGQTAYWIDGVMQKLVSRDVSAAGPPATSLFTVANATGLVRDGDRLYWLERSTGEVRRCKTPGFTGVEVVAVLPGASRLAVGDRVYLANETTRKIFALPKPP